MKAVHIEEGDAEGGGALVLVVVGHIHADQEARTADLVEECQDLIQEHQSLLTLVKVGQSEPRGKESHLI